MLRSEDFAKFYTAVHEHEPFAWQTSLVERVLDSGAWPAVVDVPTGMGKTSMIDIALFITAATAQQRGSSRLGRRRIFFVVDRRLVVDEAWKHALRLASALRKAEHSGGDGVEPSVAKALRELVGPSTTTPPVSVTRMRGGATWESSWLDRPDEVAVVVGTVDQVGSRALFRGYGVSDRRKSLDAALTGMDSLILVDEAHLAESLVRTLDAAHGRDHEGLDLPRASIVRLSATPGGVDLPTFSLEPDRHRDAPEAWRRLSARKGLSLVETGGAKVEKTMASLASRFTRTDSHRSVLVVCNTVDRARAVHRFLSEGRGETRVEGDVWLLTGRSRYVDRQAIVNKVTERFSAGRNRDSEDAPAVVVSTQTIEVGANLDAEVLISESASWDAIVQRLGRLNRLGRHPGEAYAVVVHDGVTDGPVYGSTRDVTWRFLRELDPREPVSSADDLQPGGGPDLGPLSCRDLVARVPHDALAPRPITPLLQTATLDAWAHTGPIPLCDPPLDPFLHGIDAGLAGVLVAWRDGIDDPTDPDMLVDEARADALMTTLPVRADEQMLVPFGAMLRWMRGESPVPVDDLDASPEVEGKARTVADPFEVLAWRDDRPRRQAPGQRRRKTDGKRWRWITADELRPGDTVVVPSARGGIDEFGWNPRSTTRALDVLERAALTRGHPVLRLDRALYQRWSISEPHVSTVRALVSDLERVEDPDAWTELEQQLTQALRQGLAVQDPAGEGSALAAWLEGGKPHLLRVPTNLERRDESQLWVLTGGSATPLTDEHELVTAPDHREDDEPIGSSVGGDGKVTLPVHHENVGRRAAEIARALGLPDRLTRLVEQAARWHDLGKLEERFQAMLHGGDSVAALVADEPLAKSGTPADDHAARRRSRQMSGLPTGARHEAWSASLVSEYLRAAPKWTSDDADLLVHLVASHHGHARPWLPPVEDKDPRKITAWIVGAEVSVTSDDTVDFSHPTRFAALNAQYGRWGLALLESIVRCADMTVSREGS